MPRDEFLDRIRGIVRADSLFFVNYWEHKGEFVGRVTQTGFRVTRFIREIWVPLVFGRVLQNGDGCRLSVIFFAPESVICLLAIGLFSVPVARAGGAGFLAIPLLWLVMHIRGCWRFKHEVKRFLAAVGIEENR